MFNYIRSDQVPKKTAPKKPMVPKFPITPIENKVNMPIEMQPIPQPDSDVTCFYPDMNIQPNMPQQPMPMPPMPMPTPIPPMPMPTPMPCGQCMHCMHYNMCMQPMPIVPATPTPLPMPVIPPTSTPLPTPDPSCDMSKNHDDMEVAYINKMYPPLCQKIQKYVESELNQYDHDLSPIYEMYPSTSTIDHMANCIYTDMKATMGNLIKEFEGNPCTRSPIGGSFYTLIYALLLNELYRKRMRRRLYR